MERSTSLSEPFTGWMVVFDEHGEFEIPQNGGNLGAQASPLFVSLSGHELESHQ